ncbi:G5 and 3D domain-containing protein [Endomicrobium proavitum]|uniref:3D domain-containing protein n=1 Tax=Endomicrobium proavitum TaxID=1408281 RepID=A0A0G3WIW8_9BACT|nr:3D domain-containing protein [Endomicrobium proavitum]AKL97439.1 conserved exported protein of unknown function [Endomicrobium proavitum]
MKTKIKIPLKIAVAAAGIFIFSILLHLIDISKSRAYVRVDNKIITVKPYKFIPLKTILARINITLGKNDIISRDLNKPLPPLKTAKITRVKKQTKKITEKIPFRVTWSRVYNSNLRKTQLQRGVEKTVIRIVSDIYYDGKLHKREVLNERSIAKEHYRLALLTPDNKVEKVYNLSKMKRKKMVATAYYPGDPLAWGDGTVTFLGQKMQRGIVAVDPKVIPLKTRLFISGYGYGYAGDTGNLIKGNRVDLGVNNAKEEQSWMFRDVTVYILEPSSKY